MLDAIAERAAKLCEAEDAAIYRVDGSFSRVAAHFGPIPLSHAADEARIIDRGRPPGRAIVDRQTIHVHDLRAAEAEFPGAKTYGITVGLRSVLSTPLLREGVAIGAIYIRRTEVRPFTDKQIALLKTFADQAVIAIENARLFQELGDKTTSLNHPTPNCAKHWNSKLQRAEILGVIASSPTDIQPVLNAVAESAARLCESVDAQIYRVEGDNVRKWRSTELSPVSSQSARPCLLAAVSCPAEPFSTDNSSYS